MRHGIKLLADDSAGGLTPYDALWTRDSVKDHHWHTSPQCCQISIINVSQSNDIYKSAFGGASSKFQQDLQGHMCQYGNMAVDSVGNAIIEIPPSTLAV